MKQLVLSRNAHLRSHLQYAASLIHVGITTHHASHVAVAGTVSVSPLSDALSLSLSLSLSLRVCVFLSVFACVRTSGGLTENAGHENAGRIIRDEIELNYTY